ncbi:MAG: BamA/TamA family outer membrane protein [Bacteroidetes bacterium]|nr:BamA/TamA family outer membrane protein [Bacteroidota bacterium]
MRNILLLLFAYFFGCYAYAQQDTAVHSNTFVVKQIFLMGQKKTKDGIILRELNFKEGDSINIDELPKLFAKSKKQLLNTNLFNEVEIVSDSNMNVFVVVKEDWYIYPVPILKIADRNFNQWWLSKDFNRINYGLWTYWYNFTGNADKLSILLNSGYTHLTSIGYSIPFIDRKKHWGLGFQAAYSANREVGILSKNDKLNFFSDRNHFLIWRKGISLNSSYRKGLFDKHLLSITFLNIHVADTIVSNEVNNQYLSKGKSRQNKLSLGYDYIYDKRDLRGYPLNGYFLKTSFDYDLYNPLNSVSEQNFRISTTLNYYKELPQKLYANAGITASTSHLKMPAYDDFIALGYGNEYIRGYEYYVIDGKDFAYFRSNLKYALIKEKKQFTWMLPSAFRTITFTWMAGLFFDAGYVNSPMEYPDNTLPNSLMIGYGLGTDLVFFYDRVIRLEFSRNRMNKNGFYISFYAPL